jgi:hypothetical protein
MSDGPVTRVSTRLLETETRELFFKDDRPRQIDRYIDYFGTSMEQSGMDADIGGAQDDW